MPEAARPCAAMPGCPASRPHSTSSETDGRPWSCATFCWGRSASGLADGLPGIGTNTLTARLKPLQEAGHRAAPAARGYTKRGAVYELTELGRELEPILMALGAGAREGMGRLPARVSTRSRWLVAAMLAFHDETRSVRRACVWRLRLSDGDFRSGQGAGADHRGRGTGRRRPGHRDRRHALARPADRTGLAGPAVKSGAVTVDGDRALLTELLSLFAFPTIEGVDLSG